MSDILCTIILPVTLVLEGMSSSPYGCNMGDRPITGTETRRKVKNRKMEPRRQGDDREMRASKRNGARPTVRYYTASDYLN